MGLGKAFFPYLTFFFLSTSDLLSTSGPGGWQGRAWDISCGGWVGAGIR